MGWMHPEYARLRRAAAAGYDSADDRALDLVSVNLDRARLLPAADAPGRYVLVDAAAARLWMYENGRVAGTMRVVVGKPEEPTPMMAGLIRYANVNPYWNLPPDLVRLRVAPGALEKGQAFLKAKRFEVLSGWEPNARVVNASAIDWRAVLDGRTDARVRQLPGPNNAMGRIKFMFPNDKGVYLHDTPEKALMREDDRLFSSGCVRVEDAPRLARWLFGKPVSLKTATPEKRVDLPAPVPVYITSLTVAAEGQDMVFRPDVYRRDGVQLAGGDAERFASR
jgi:murein L,D-transpeptidase YcbB/YkuD